MSDRSPGHGPSRVTAVLGPTNTGKTHLAVERMCGHASGMIGLPLRLLAREVYDRVVALKGKASVALITGEEKIVPGRPSYWVSTVEAMPLERSVDFLAVDEVQLAADPARGHIFTHRLLNARGRFETMFLGAGTMAPLIRRLLPDVHIETRDRFSRLTYAGPKKLTRLPPRSAVVAFSADAVYAIAELIRRQRGGAAVVMGALSPRTRNAQVELYQSGEVDFLVATDAIGMGLNMDVDHVAFAALRKFDGKRTRWLNPPEVGQIAGRAGRFTRDGTFGVTGDCDDMDADLVEAVEEHAFEPVPAIEWRSGRLDLTTLPNLMASLARPPERQGLRLAAEALDEATLRRLAAEGDIAAACRDRSKLIKLWDACQIPDFRKTTLDEHLRLVREVFEARTGPGHRLSEDWIAPQFAALDTTAGEIDVLAGRLSHIRTLAYLANRPQWLTNADHWRGETQALEERLSDALHERLKARFVDRRTSVLMRALKDSSVHAQVSDAGQVTVEGETVGTLDGLVFVSEAATTTVADRTLRTAARRAVEPEVVRRLGALAADQDSAFDLLPDGTITWNGTAVAALAKDARPFQPRARLFGELGAAPARERAVRRIEAYLAAESARRLQSLHRLNAALSNGKLKGLARGVAWRLVEAWGLIDRAEVEADLAALSKVERRALRMLGVHIGAHSLWLPQLQTKKPRAFLTALALPLDPASPQVLAARGARKVGDLTVSADTLERWAEARREAQGKPLAEDVLSALGWTEDQAKQVAAALKKAAPKMPKPERAERIVRDSPFAALAVAKPASTPTARHRPRRRRRASPP
ncbi:DEAD/DEAH box helicase [Brevundimonas aveniformis]|uniref:DEAD/DEAH box helicase n=1 Tax=Brevundimonas aveniformis TaxID=370977 RepID=UPI002491940C|nr:DEAD/DEAH box helicase [Brevundimonas aveniformis]